MFHVILVDDQDSFRRAIRNMLESDGAFQVIAEAHDGAEAVEIATNGLIPDLVLMDVQMPNMDGFEATRKIMEHRPTRIVLMSMNDDAAYSRAAAEAGAVAFFRKRDFKARDLLTLLGVHGSASASTSF